MKNIKKKLIQCTLSFLLIAFPFCLCSYGEYQKEFSPSTFAKSIFSKINEERRSRGLSPLAIDPVANTLAVKHSIANLNLGYLTHQEPANPDERYSGLGGSGSVTEILKGFEVDEGEILLSESLSNHLVEALIINQDDYKVIFDRNINNIGLGLIRSSDKKRLVIALEFLLKAGSFSSVPKRIKLDVPISIMGMISSPYTFKAISLAYLDHSNIQNHAEVKRINIDDLKPYFPPQSYIAYGNTRKSKIRKILSGIGLIGAIGASPFTGGASSILAPVFLHNMKDNSPREIPLKGGVKLDEDGTFNLTVKLNNQNMLGVYFINVLAELPGESFPVVVSRRTVEVQ